MSSHLCESSYSVVYTAYSYSIYSKQVYTVLQYTVYTYSIYCLCGIVDRLLDTGDGEQGSNPRSRILIYNWVAPLWLVFILHVSQCLIDLIQYIQYVACNDYTKIVKDQSNIIG